jgi:hypothetical protein
MDQNKRSRHKPMHLQSTDLQQRSSKHTMEKRQPLQQLEVIYEKSRANILNG